MPWICERRRCGNGLKGGGGEEQWVWRKKELALFLISDPTITASDLSPSDLKRIG